MRRLVLGTIGLLVALLLLWGFARHVSSNWRSPSGFSDQKQEVGSVGGFHLVDKVTFEDKGEFVRFFVPSQLNREGVTTENLVTPLSRARIMKNTEPSEIREIKPAAFSDLGNYRIELVLTDSRINKEGVSGNGQNEKESAVNLGAVNKWRLWQSSDNSTLVLLIGLDKKTKFRLQADSADPGIVLLDILTRTR